LINVIRNGALQKKGKEIAMFSPIAHGKCSERLRQPLSTSTRVLESCWEIFKGYWKASGQFLKSIGKPKYPPSANRRGG
jgi:hypothetical protein